MAGVNRFSIDSQQTTTQTGIFDETVCGIVFDTSRRSDVFKDFQVATEKYSEGDIRRLTSLDEVVESGITEGGIMGGVPYYHLKHFFTLAGKDSRTHVIYVTFADCSSDFSILNRMMHESKRKIFQIGIWTEQDIFAYYGDELYSPLMNKISENLFYYGQEMRSGGDFDRDIPFNVLLCANPTATRYVDTVIYLTDGDGSRIATKDGYQLTGTMPVKDNTFSYRTLPDITGYNMPGLTVLLGQENSDAVHTMQEKNMDKTPVGCVGAALGVLTICPVEYRLDDNSQFSLKDVIPSAELGFGTDNTPIKNLNYIRRNGMESKGYVFLVDREDAQGETFFSGQRTLGKRDYCNLVRCRTINKVHRIVRSVMINYVNGPHRVTASNGTIPAATATAIENEIYAGIDAYMGVGSGTNGASQLDYRMVDVPTDQSIADKKTLTAEIEIRPGDHTDSIVLSEEVVVA